MYSYQILKLTLQPLVENALYHGIKNKRGLGHILVTGEQREETMIFRVRDDGMGMDEERLKDVREIISGELVDQNNPSGFGLFNVNQRLRLNYGAFIICSKNSKKLYLLPKEFSFHCVKIMVL